MSLIRVIHSVSVAILIIVMQAVNVIADMIVLDSFEHGGDASVSTESSYLSSVTVPSLPFGTHRRIEAVTRSASGVGSVEASIDNASGTLSMETTRTNFVGRRDMSIHLYYEPDPPGDQSIRFSLSDYTAFAFEFEEIQGDGMMLIEVGYPIGIHAVPDDMWLPLRSMDGGQARYPISQVAVLNSNRATPESFSAIMITVRSAQGDFSFTLNEILLVPEPGTIGLMLLGGFGLFRAQRRLRVLDLDGQQGCFVSLASRSHQIRRSNLIG